MSVPLRLALSLSVLFPPPSLSVPQRLPPYLHMHTHTHARATSQPRTHTRVQRHEHGVVQNNVRAERDM